MKEKGLLKQMLIMVIIVLIAFFSLYIKVDAANFAYNDFDWDLLSIYSNDCRYFLIPSDIPFASFI